MVEIIRLWDASGNACNPITQFTDLTIIESLNTVYSIEFNVALDSDVAKEIEIEGFLECDDKRFTIKEIVRRLDDNTAQVYGIGECDGLKYKRCYSFSVSKKTVGQALTEVLDGRSTGWTWRYGSDTYQPTQKRTLKLTKSDAGTVWSVIQKIITKWNVEIDFDCVNHVMTVYKSKRLGQQSALTVFYEDLNLQDFERSLNSNEVINNVIAYGKTVTKNKQSVETTIEGAEREDGTTVNVKYVNEVNDLGKDAPTIPKEMRGYYLDTQEDDPQELYNAAVDYLEDNCSPGKSYSIKISDLAVIDPNYSEFYEVHLGDTIGIASHTLDARYNLRVVKITRKPNEVDAMEIELSNKKATTALSTAKERQITNAMIDTYQTPVVGDTILVANNAIKTDNILVEAITADLIKDGAVTTAKMGETTVNTLMENAVASMQENLENASGYLRMNYNANGQPVSLDAVDSTNSNNLFRFYAGGLYYSTNGGTTFSRIGISSNGAIVASSIASGSVISNSVTMSNLTLTGGSINMVGSTSEDDVIVLRYGTYRLELSPGGVHVTDGSTTNHITPTYIGVGQSNIQDVNGTVKIVAGGLKYNDYSVLAFGQNGTAIVDQVGYSGSSLSSGGARDITVSAAKTGYTPIGIVGTQTNGILVKYAYLSSSNIVSARIKNDTSNDVTPSADFTILYAKN